MSFNYNETYDFLSKLNQKKNSRRNKYTELYLELAFNYELLRSYSSPSRSDLFELPILNPDETEIKSQSDSELKKVALQVILKQLRADSFQYWISSSHNLNKFGLILSGNGKIIPYWVFLSSLMNRIATISARLDIRFEHQELEPHFVKVNANVHLKRLRKDMGKALNHLHYFRESPWIKRTFLSIRKKTLVIKVTK